MNITFDQAVELLEITDISKIGVNDVLKIEKRAKARWHPDKVAGLNNPDITKEYTEKFQQIEPACSLITAYLNGTYHAGEAFTGGSQAETRPPEDIIRENAADMQSALKQVWNAVKQQKFKYSIEEVTLSDGFKLKDLLREDFDEDIASLSVVSFFYGCLLMMILSLILGAINPGLGVIASIFWFLQSLSCIFGFLPLSRFWMPEPIQQVMIWFINFGLHVYNWAKTESQMAAWWVQLLVAIPNLFALAIKFIILLPLYEIAKLMVGDKVVGVVKKKVDYYAGAADWYIEDLIKMPVNQMTSDNLFHLSYLYGEFKYTA